MVRAARSFAGELGDGGDATVGGFGIGAEGERFNCGQENCAFRGFGGTFGGKGESPKEREKEG